MTSLTTLPESSASTSQSSLRGLPAFDQQVAESRKDLVAVTNRLANTDSSKYTSTMFSRQLLKAVQRFSETMLSSARTSRELLQAIYTWKETGTSTFYFFKAQLQLLESIYTLREPRKVFRFLERNTFLAPLLIEAYPKLENRFPDSQIFLEVDTDPEEGNDQQLLVLIATTSSPKEALRRLKELDEDWWLDALDRAQGKLCINLV